MVFSYLYVHIPFCLQKCNYCDFVSFTNGSEESMVIYSQLLENEISFWQKQNTLGNLQTVYFGGGTPSIMPVDCLAHFLSCLPLDKNAEISLEANPATLNIQKLRALKQCGFNRISIGLQSFHEGLLKSMGRLHDANDGMIMVENARKAGFDNINIDLMYGLPGQTIDIWRDTLRKAIALQTEHISVYGLHLEESTPWGKAEASGALLLPEEDASLAMWQITHHVLAKAGFENYEIANYARPGFACRHNLAYWQREDYLGIGLAAASCWQNKRWVNTENWQTYTQCWQNHTCAPYEEEVLTMGQVLAERIFLGLRLKNGICIAEIEEQFGVDLRTRFYKDMLPLFQNDLLAEKDGFWYLTQRGKLLANEVFAAFLP